MKILRAIGHFFAKIGRWIANTAWVQPLLIVGGIFAIIFSIPYIKRGFENLFAKENNTEYAWYQAQALSLEENGQADRLLGYLENYNAENHNKIKGEFGSKFILSLVKQDCTNCKDAYDGYINAISNGYVQGFKMWTILVDKMDDAGKEYLAKPIYAKHTGLFEQLVEYYGECDDEDYPLYRNLITKNKSSVVSTMKTKSSKLDAASTSDEGLDTPLTMVVDLEKYDAGYYGCNGITQLFYNYIDFDLSGSTNAATKGMVIRDFWNYEGVFDPEMAE